MLLAYPGADRKEDVDFSGRDALYARAQSGHEILPVEAVSNPLLDVVTHRQKVLAIRQQCNQQIVPSEVAICIDKLSNRIGS